MALHESTTGCRVIDVEWLFGTSPPPLCVFGGRSVHNSPGAYRGLFFNGIAIGSEREYRAACQKHKRAKHPKGGFVGMQPLESQAHYVGSDSRTNDEAGEQISVQLPEAFHSEIS